MRDIDDELREIMSLQSLLPSAQGQEFLDRASEQTMREDTRTAKEEVLDNLRRIKAELRNLLPDYDTLMFDDFKTVEAIDVVTIGRNIFSFEDDQLISIPSGTRLRKSEGTMHLTIMGINFDNGVTLYVKEKSFPEFGIRIEPQEEE